METVTDYTFTDVDLDSPADDVPDMDITTPEFVCEVCGKALTYSGRGRKPRFCDEHKKGSKGTVRRATGARNVAVASQAADVLMTTNSFVQFMASMGGLENTAEAIETANPQFRERAYEALLNDPELAKAITRGGAMTGKMALVMAYSMFAFSVVPVAYLEVKVKKAEREKELE